MLLLYSINVLIIFYFFGEKIFRWLLYGLEAMARERAPPITWTHNDMIEIANKKRDSEMTDEEMRIKYGYSCHELWRVTTMSRKTYDLLDCIFHKLEIQYYGGIQSLRKTYPIIKPIFIIGDFRSGTSVLERIIFHHPCVAAYTMTNVIVWRAPLFWDKIVLYWESIRQDMGPRSSSWIRRGGPGVYYQHSSGRLLNRDTPCECEIIWSECKRNLFTNRYKSVSEDNSSNADLIDENYSDPHFEEMFKNSICMILALQSSTRFIHKNPLNGFRIGFLYRMFPDAKFIHISRNPKIVLSSQITLHHSVCKSCYIEDLEFRQNEFKPKIPENLSHNDKHWSVFTRGNYLNQFYYQLWFPRLFPRVAPEYEREENLMKEGKVASAFATAIAQHERVVLETLERCHICEGKNLMTIWHEDLLEDPITLMLSVFDFLELPVTREQCIQFLEQEDFKNGQANPKRKCSSKRNFEFGDETLKIEKILAHALERFENREQFSQRSSLH